jgi:hypothetical protein
VPLDPAAASVLLPSPLQLETDTTAAKVNAATICLTRAILPSPLREPGFSRVTSNTKASPKAPDAPRLERAVSTYNYDLVSGKLAD